MREEFIQRKCDQCGKTKLEAAKQGYGSIPFRGWLAIHQSKSPLGMSPTAKEAKVDFCSWDCVVASRQEP